MQSYKSYNFVTVIVCQYCRLRMGTFNGYLWFWMQLTYDVSITYRRRIDDAGVMFILIDFSSINIGYWKGDFLDFV